MKRIIMNLAVFILAGMIFPSLLPAGKIYLKDGSIELSDKIWETDQFIHFILSGTKSVEIRFSKNIVDKIEYNDGTIKALDYREKANEDEPEKIKPKNSVTPVKPTEIRAFTNLYLSEEAKQKILWENRGLVFYDPRRKERFWARRDARFGRLEQAIEALSAQYNRPPDWIEKYMGEENELTAIHKNLINQVEREMAGSEIVYPPEAGESPKIETSAVPEKKTIAPLNKPQKPIPPKSTKNGLKFYDPRRPEKYWSSANDHHQTLNDAIKALARHYRVTPQWIESHMGSTNELEDIHRHIQQSLEQVTR